MTDSVRVEAHSTLSVTTITSRVTKLMIEYDVPEKMVIPGNGACSDHLRSERNEVSPLLSTPQVTEKNREQHLHVDGGVDTDSPTQPKCQRELRRVKRELNEVVVWKLKLWTLLLIIFLAIALVIGISIIVCSAVHDDKDEKYDKSSFVVARFFRGNFTLDANSFTSNSQDEETMTELKQQLGRPAKL
ncbi:hypothetical protein cypCar_00030455 [Cyprinus carpio]|nr:hypothetical protein cypCar_00030455 [Cyprinus carpio]